MGFVPSAVAAWWEGYHPPSGRAGELWSSYLSQIQARTDRLFYILLLIQYPTAVAVALLWSPRAWAGSTSTVHFHVWFAVLFGGLVTSLPVYLIRCCPAAPMTRHVVAVAQMLMGAMLIHLTGGRIETHFHVFGSLAFLAFYSDIRVLVTATLVVSADHFFRGLFFPTSVYGITSGANWRFVEHAFWVVFENGFLALSCLHRRAQLRAMAGQQAELEAVNERIEGAVQLRTRELALKTEELAASRDAAMESTRLKSQFLANVSHEIRTPMNGILGMTALLLETDLTPDQRDHADTVQRSAEGLLAIINDILDLSKIEAGKLVLERVDFVLWNEVEDVVQLLIDGAERNNIELVCHIDRTTPMLVGGDAGRLRQVLLNLTGNAIKFTTDGEVALRVSEVSRTENTSRVRFEISDTGIGIPEDAGKKLFTAFVQVDGSTTRRHEGTGLGLAISKQLVESMGGEIGFHSTFGEGSTFWFEIPLDVLTENGTSPSLDWGGLRDLRILIVDDNATNRTVVRTMCTSWGIHTQEASDGQQALSRLAEAAANYNRFDAVLLDFQMPEMDGIQLARIIHQDAKLKGTPLVMLTSLGQRAVCNSLLKVGIGTCMVKPVRRDHLFLAIAKVCGRVVTSPTHDSRGAAEEDNAEPMRRLSVLVAEDNVVNQRVLSGMLSRLGHQCDVVADGEAALRAVQSRHYDVVFMDCQMPRLDGFQATAAIRALSHPSHSVPIVAVTANAMSGDQERCLAAGMTGYIAKPVRFQEIRNSLSGILAHATDNAPPPVTAALNSGESAATTSL